MTRPALGLAALLLAFAAWQLSHLGGFQWSLDEGLNLMRGWLLAQGFSLYRDIWADQPPLFTALLAVVLRFAGNSVEAGRALVVVHAAGALLGVAWVVRELDRRWVGALAGVVLLWLAPNFFWASRAVMPGLPALSLAILSLGATLAALRTGRRRWLVVAGAVLALSALEKLISVYLVLPLLLAILLRTRPAAEPRGRGIVLDLLATGAAGLLPVLVVLALGDPRALLDQVAGTYLRAREAYHLNIDRNLATIGSYLTVDNLGLSALGAFGLLVLFRRHSVADLVVLAWLLLHPIAIATQSPLWPEHHLLPLLAALAILAGVAVDGLAASLPLPSRKLGAFGKVGRATTEGSPLRINHDALREGWGAGPWLVLGLAALAVWLLSFPRPLQVDARLLAAQSYEANGDLPGARPYTEAWQAVDAVSAATRPGDFVLTDSMMIAFRAGRPVPPWLSVLSRKRIQTGQVTDADLIRASLEYGPTAVLSWDDRLTEAPGFLTWLRKWYRPARDFGRDRILYLPVPLAEVSRPAAAVLGEQVELAGYRLSAAALRPGEELALTVFWRGVREVSRSYTVFTHLVGPDGKLHGQQDGLPAAGLLTTDAWRPGVVVPDEHVIRVAPDAPPGSYEVRVGMYEPATGARLPAVAPGGRRVPEDSVVLAQVEVVP